jgi:hypothetical protein
MNLTWPRPCLLCPPFLRLKPVEIKTREREIRRIRKKNKTNNIEIWREIDLTMVAKAERWRRSESYDSSALEIDGWARPGQN